MDPHRPPIRCVVGYLLPGGELRVYSKVVSQEDARELAEFGWMVLDDPFDWEELTRYEQLERALSQRSTWNKLILGGGD